MTQITSIKPFTLTHTRLQLRDPSACIELRLDLSEHHRLAEISGVLALAGNEQALQVGVYSLDWT